MMLMMVFAVSWESIRPTLDALGDEPVAIYVFLIVITVLVGAVPISCIHKLLRRWQGSPQGKRRWWKSPKNAYYDSLRRLKRDPNNPDLRQETIQLGRKYAAKAKDWRGRPVFDEAKLTNDLFAACARATTGETTVAKVEVTNLDALGGENVAEEIEKLGQLFLKGVITAEEFERGKTLFLGTPPDKAAAAIELLQNLDALRKQGVLSQSEFNMKKWEILSERLLPGKRSAADL